MEKFTTWRDPSTGIHPFLPVAISRNGGAGGLLYEATGILLAMIRIPLVMFFSALWLLSLAMLSLPMRLKPQGAFRLLRLVDSLFGRVILVLLGYFYIPRRRMVFRQAAAGEEISLTLARPGQPASDEEIHEGDLIICNHQSPIDIIYLCTLYRVVWGLVTSDVCSFSPTFTTVDCASKQIHACSRWFALLNCGQTGMREQGHTLSLSSVLAKAHSPVVVFPEGTTSNGRALLHFTGDLGQVASNQRMHLMALKYMISGGGFLPALAIPGMRASWSFLWNTCRQWYNSLAVKWVASDSLYSSTAVPTPGQPDLNASLMRIYAALLHTRCVSLSQEDKRAFLVAFNSRRK